MSTAPRLERHVGTRQLWLISISSTIGSGWLFSALFAAQAAGPAAVVAWVLGGCIIMLIALIYAELGTMFPEAGGLARYPLYSHGRLVSLYGSWMVWVAYVASSPIEVMAVVEYMAEFLPGVEKVESGGVVLTGTGIAISLALLLVFCFINLVGVRWLARVNDTIATWKLFVPLLAAIALMATRFDTGNFGSTAPGGFAPFGFAGVATAMSTGGIVFAFIGFRTTLELAGEVKNPQRALPVAIIGGLATCIVVYILLQVAFIGALSPADLASGWGQVRFDVATGPFAALATAVGLTWLATILYADAAISPGGSALVLSAATARLSYAMAKSGYLPKALLRLNRFGVPATALVVNFVIGALFFLPFPGWQKLVGFISSAAILSFALGPISLIALRKQLPAHERPYRLPLAAPLATLGFVVANLIFYWTGWETNRVLSVGVLAGFLIAGGLMAFGGAEERKKWDLHGGLWLVPYLATMLLISYLGNFGNGTGTLPAGWDMVIVAAVSLPIFRLAVRHRLPVVDFDE